MEDFEEKYLKVFNNAYGFMRKCYLERPAQKTFDDALDRTEKTFNAYLLKAAIKELNRVSTRDNSKETFKANYFNLYGDVFKFMEKHYGAKTHEEWVNLLNDSKKLCDKYPDNMFSQDLQVAVIEELEKVFRAGG